MVGPLHPVSRIGTSTRAAALARFAAAMLTLAVPFSAACSATTIPGVADTAPTDTGAADTDAAGTGPACGATSCLIGQLCCAGSDEFCSPTCMSVEACPVFGRPCKSPDSGTAETGAGDAPSGLRWYSTCGYPVCGGPTPDAGNDGGASDGATCAAVGTPCTTKGDTCGTPSAANCGIVSVCDDHDPTSLGCPKSSRNFKDGIDYLGNDDLARLHDETMSMRLATYNYKTPYADPNPRHLGFIIEDQPLASYAVDRRREGVDMYGYLSMVVATMQVQEREIAELRKELATVKTAACR